MDQQYKKELIECISESDKWLSEVKARQKSEGEPVDKKDREAMARISEIATIMLANQNELKQILLEDYGISLKTEN